MGMLWTNVPFVRGSESATEVLGQCKIPMFKGDKWPTAFQKVALIQTFGVIPDFVITLFALWCDAASDRNFCSLFEHELYHADLKREEMGEPVFGKDGSPRFAMQTTTSSR